jgi:hypothetical protein
MANDLTARGLALRGINDAANALAATQNLVEILTIAGSGSNRTLTGKAPPNTQVTLYDNGVAIGTTSTGSAGTWTFRATGLTNGSHNFTARAPVGSQASSANVSDTTPVATDFAELPRRGFRVFCDAISLLQWGLDYGTHRIGDGAAALAANLSANSQRDQLLRFSTDSGAGSAFVAERLRFVPHGGNRTTATGADTSMAAGFWIMTLCPVSGQGEVFASYASATQRGEQFRVGFAPSGTGFRLTVNGTLTGREIAWTSMVRLRLSWASSGALVLESRIIGESGYTGEFAGSPAPIAPIQTLRWGLWNCTGQSDVRFADVATSDASFADIDRDWTLAGSGTRDVSQTSAAVAVVLPDGIFAGMDRVRLRHAPGLDPSAGTPGPWVPVAGKSRNVLPLTLTALSPNTVHSYQIEIADSEGTVLHSSEPYRLRTLAPAGTAQASELNFTSCYVQTPKCHPYADDQYTLDSITADYLGTVNLGDLGYEAGYTIETSQYLLERPPLTEAQFEQKLREFCADPVLHRLFLAGMYMAIPDDHETINQIDGTSAAGGANETTPARFYWGANNTANYDPATTLGQIRTRGLAVFDAWFAAHWLDRPTPGVYYQKKILGNVEIIFLDTRYERNPTTGHYVSPAQLAWVQSAVGAIAGTTRLVLFVSQTAFSQYSSKEGESWQEVAPGQYSTLIDHVIANCPCNFLFVSGDDHVGYALHRQIATNANPVTPSRCLGELRASGGSTPLIRNMPVPALSEWYFDYRNLNGTTDLLRSSGVLCRISASGEQVALSARAAGSTSGIMLGSVAPVSTRKVRLAVDPAYIGANNAAGTVDAAILLCRADLPDEICDPASPNRATFADGRDIRARTPAGVPLAIEVVNFAYDSTTGARDANVEIWVRHLWDKAATSEFDLLWGDASGLATRPDGQAVWPSDALAVYHCKDTKDATGRGRGLTLTDTTIIDGPAGKALNFNGSTSKASAGFTPVAGSSARTEVMLFRARPTNGKQAFFYYYGLASTAGSAGDRWSLAISAASVNKLVLGVSGGSQTGSSNVTDNNWHVAVVQLAGGTNTSNIRIYVDGVEDTYATSSKAIATGTATLGIGAIGDLNFANFDLAELRFYSGALSADRVATIGKTLSAIGGYITTGLPGEA